MRSTFLVVSRETKFVRRVLDTSGRDDQLLFFFVLTTRIFGRTGTYDEHQRLDVSLGYQRGRGVTHGPHVGPRERLVPEDGGR